MGSTLDLGQRIELVSMDPHFENITLGLYEQPGADGASDYLVHSYSGLAGVARRLEMLTRAMQILGGLELCRGRLRFPCGVKHQLAMRRTFLEACKLDSLAALEARPMSVVDKKLDRPVSARNLGSGLYELAVDGQAEGAATRLEAITGGMRKLAEVDFVLGEPHRFQFLCGQAHDALVGLLLPRALNVRASLRELEMAAARGMLAAPSAQK